MNGCRESSEEPKERSFLVRQNKKTKTELGRTKLVGQAEGEEREEIREEGDGEMVHHRVCYKPVFFPSHPWKFDLVLNYLVRSQSLEMP